MCHIFKYDMIQKVTNSQEAQNEGVSENTQQVCIKKLKNGQKEGVVFRNFYEKKLYKLPI